MPVEMNKRIALTMRVELSSEYPEVRDAISHDWISFVEDKSCSAYLIPNLISDARKYLSKIQPAAVILTGGNDLGIGNNVEFESPTVSKIRDDFECEILKYCIQEGRPVLGVCRGMQLINLFFGGGIIRHLNKRSKNYCHSGGEHEIEVINESFARLIGSSKRIVNSYHKHGVRINDLSRKLVTLAQTGQVVEALAHKTLPILGIQWHPERDKGNRDLDFKILQSLLKGFANISR